MKICQMKNILVLAPAMFCMFFLSACTLYDTIENLNEISDVAETESSSSEMSSSSVAGSSSGMEPASVEESSSSESSFECGTKFVDDRDTPTRSYFTIKIGNQCWFAENLQYRTKLSKCYAGEESNCGVYGAFYRFSEAKDACPKGSRLPSILDWGELSSYIHVSDAGNQLKSTDLWQTASGSDNFSFTALPAGRIRYDGDSKMMNEWTGFWSSTEGEEVVDSGKYLYLKNSESGILWGELETDEYLSVRCLVE